LEIISAEPEWIGTSVKFHLEQKDGITNIESHHSNWKESSEGMRISSYCWAMHLRILKQNIEFGETVPYESRLEV